MNHLKLPLNKGERPLFQTRSILEDLNRELSRSNNPYLAKNSAIVYSYIAALEVMEKLFKSRCENDRRNQNDDLFSNLSQLPLFFPEAMVKKWEIERVWASKEFCPYHDVVTYYGAILDSDKVSDAYNLVDDSQGFKTLIWKNWFSLMPREEIIEVICYSKNKWLAWENSRPSQELPIFTNSSIIGNKLQLKEEQIVAWQIYEMIASHTKYNTLWNLAIKELSIEQLFTMWSVAFNMPQDSISQLFYDDSLLVTTSIYNALDKVLENTNETIEEITKKLRNFPQLLNLLFKNLHHASNLLGYFASPMIAEEKIEFLANSSQNLEIKKIQTALSNNKLSILVYGASGKSQFVEYVLQNTNKNGWKLHLSEMMKDNELHKLAAQLSVVDKLFSNSNNVLVLDKEYKLLNEYSNQSFVKSFIEDKMTSQIWLIDDLNKINKDVLSTFDIIFQVPDMLLEDKITVANKYFDDADVALRVAQAVKTSKEIINIYNWCFNTEDYSWNNVLQYIVTHHKAVSNNEVLDLLQPIKTEENLPCFAGYPDVEKLLHKLSDYYNHPHIYKKLGAKITKGILLMGPPGTGKTHFAKHLMKSINVPMFSVDTSKLISKPENLSIVFTEARKYAPCILLMDEIDVLINSPEVFGGLDLEKQKILNSFLAQLDGINDSEGILVIGATHRKINPDPAAIRSGRLSETIHLNLPNSSSRTEIWKAHLKLKPISSNIDYDVLSHASSSFTSAEIAESVNKSAIIAAQNRHEKITMESLLQACDNVFWGNADNNMVMNDEERYKTAIHEAGHALIAWKNNFDVKRITVRPRQNALGAVSWQNQEGIFNFKKDYLIGVIETALAGLASEKVVFDEYSTGGSSDLKAARQTLRKMLLEYGFGKEFNMSYGDINEASVWSEKRKLALEDEERETLDKAMKNCLSWLEENKEYLENFAAFLLEEKEVSGEKLKFWKEKISFPLDLNATKYSKESHTVHQDSE